MAGKVIYVNEAAFQRIKEAVRRVLKEPRVGSQQRRQIPVSP